MCGVEIAGQVRGGARLLDVSALSLGKILRQKPLFRIAIFGYIAFVHMFMTILINRMQVSRILTSAYSNKQSLLLIFVV